MEKIFEQGLLYDFYGELLTEHQKRIYEDVVYHDMSLSEIAQEAGISRQGVHDLIRRCDRLLQEYEDKLHLLERFQNTRGAAEEIRRLAEEGIRQETKTAPDSDGIKTSYLRRIRDLSQELIEEL